MATIADYRDAFDPANIFTVPRMHSTRGHWSACTNNTETCTDCEWISDEPTVIISVQVGGGSEPGKAYAGWFFYELCADGEVLWEGSDLTTGTPQTARHMSGVLADYLTSYVQRCYYPGGGTEEEITAITAEHGISAELARFAIANYDRLTEWTESTGAND